MDQLEEAKGPEFGKNWAEHAAYKNLKHHQKHLEKHVRYSERYGNKANDFADSAHSVFNKMINAKSYEDGQKHMALLQNHLKNMHQHLKMEKHHDKWAEAHEKMADKLERAAEPKERGRTDYSKNAFPPLKHEN